LYQEPGEYIWRRCEKVLLNRLKDACGLKRGLSRPEFRILSNQDYQRLK